MANAILKAEKILAQGLGLLQRELILPRLVTRYGRADFQGAKNDTISVRVPSVFRGREYTWRTRPAPIVVDELNETSVPIALDTHLYHAVAITDEELTLDIASWGEQIAAPQARAVAEQAEAAIAGAMAGATYAETVPFAEGDDMAFYEALVEARRVLNLANVPQAGRYVLLGANVEAAALRSPHLVKVNEAGSDDALREATIGRIAGFTVIGSNSVDPDFAVAFHSSAFAFASVAPVVPAGVPDGATATYAGIGLRWVRDYESDYLRDRSVFSSFAGAASVEDGRDLESPVGSGFGELTGENVRAVEIEFTPAT